MKHNYKIPQMPQEEEEGLKERTNLQLNLHISHPGIQVPRPDGVVNETGENAEELWVSKYMEFLGSGKPDGGKIRLLRKKCKNLGMFNVGK